jgi:hypothetical protein
MRWCRCPWVSSLALLMTGTLALLLVSGHLSAQTAPLSGGTTLSDTGPYEAQPKLFAGPKGEALRLWYRGLPPGTGGVLLGVAAPNDAWKTLVEIIPQEKDTTAGTADLAVGPAGELTIAYQWWRRVPSSKQVRLARSTDGGKTWIQPSTSLDTSGKAFSPKVAWGRGQNVVVVWSDEQRSANVGNRIWDIYARSSSDGGSTWGPEQLLSRFPAHTQTDAYIRPELVSDGEDSFWAVWVGIRSGRSRWFLSRSKDGGRSWADPMEISGQSQSVFGQRVIRAGQRLLTVWQDKRTGRDRVFAVSSSDNGATWTSPAPVDHLPANLATDAFSPTVAMNPSGEVLVTWQDGRNGRDDIFLGRSLDGGRTWEDKDVRLDMDEQGTAMSRFPSIARAADGRIAVAWEDDRAGYEGIYLRVRSAGAQPAWGPEMLIEPPGPKKAVRIPAVLWDTDGSLYVAWEVWNYVGGVMAVAKRIDGRKVVLDRK